jgi:DNA-binding Lrp family transcriptional regulator
MRQPDPRRRRVGADTSSVSIAYTVCPKQPFARYGAHVISVFVFVNASSSAAVATLGQTIADVPGVYECYSVTGEHDVIAVLRVRSHDDIFHIVAEQIAGLPGVASTRTVIAYKTYSTADQLGI